MKPAETQRTIAAIHRHAAELDRLLPALAKAHAQWLPDGYPRGGQGGGQGSGSRPKGVPADPTGELVAALDAHQDHVDADVEQVERDLAAAEQLLARVVGWIGRANQTHHAVPASRTEGCANCKRAGHWAPIRAKGLCRWCTDVKGDFGRVPTSELVDLHHRGHRLTARAIARALGTDVPARLSNR